MPRTTIPTSHFTPYNNLHEKRGVPARQVYGKRSSLNQIQKWQNLNDGDESVQMARNDASRPHKRMRRDVDDDEIEEVTPPPTSRAARQGIDARRAGAVPDVPHVRSGPVNSSTHKTKGARQQERPQWTGTRAGLIDSARGMKAPARVLPDAQDHIPTHDVSDDIDESSVMGRLNSITNRIARKSASAQASPIRQSPNAPTLSSTSSTGSNPRLAHSNTKLGSMKPERIQTSPYFTYPEQASASSCPTRLRKVSSGSTMSRTISVGSIDEDELSGPTNIATQGPDNGHRNSGKSAPVTRASRRPINVASIAQAQQSIDVDQDDEIDDSEPEQMTHHGGKGGETPSAARSATPQMSKLDATNKKKQPSEPPAHGHEGAVLVDLENLEPQHHHTSAETAPLPNYQPTKRASAHATEDIPVPAKSDDGAHNLKLAQSEDREPERPAAQETLVAGHILPTAQIPEERSADTPSHGHNQHEPAQALEGTQADDDLVEVSGPHSMPHQSRSPNGTVGRRSSQEPLFATLGRTSPSKALTEHEWDSLRSTTQESPASDEARKGASKIPKDANVSSPQHRKVSVPAPVIDEPSTVQTILESFLPGHQARTRSVDSSSPHAGPPQAKELGHKFSGIVASQSTIPLHKHVPRKKRAASPTDGPLDVRSLEREAEAPALLAGIEAVAKAPVSDVHNSSPPGNQQVLSGILEEAEAQPPVRQTRRRTTRQSSSAVIPAIQCNESETVVDTPRPLRPERRYVRPWIAPLIYPASGTKRTTVNFEDLERLDEDNFLNDNLINFALRRIEMDHTQVKESVHVFNTYLYTSLTRNNINGSGIDYGAVKSWTKKIDLFSFPYIVIPMNKDFHWFVLIIWNAPGLIAQYKKETVAEVPGVADANLDREQSAPSSIWTDIDIVATEKVSNGIKDLSLDGVATPALDSKNEVACDNSRREAHESELKKDDHVSSVSSRDKCAAIGAAPTVIFALDSMGGTHPVEIKKVKLFLAAEAAERKGVEIDYTQIQGINAKRIPMQNNTFDCGLFVIRYVMAFMQDPAKFCQHIYPKTRNGIDGDSLFDGVSSADELRRKIRKELINLERAQSAQRARDKQAAKAEKAARRQALADAAAAKLAESDAEQGRKRKASESDGPSSDASAAVEKKPRLEDARLIPGHPSPQRSDNSDNVVLVHNPERDQSDTARGQSSRPADDSSEDDLLVDAVDEQQSVTSRHASTDINPAAQKRRLFKNRISAVTDPALLLDDSNHAAMPADHPQSILTGHDEESSVGASSLGQARSPPGEERVQPNIVSQICNVVTSAMRGSRGSAAATSKG